MQIALCDGTVSQSANTVLCSGTWTYLDYPTLLNHDDMITLSGWTVLILASAFAIKAVARRIAPKMFS